MALFTIDNEPAEINWKAQEPIQRILQNAKNLLMCAMWEVPFDRTIGFNTTRFELPEQRFREELMPELDRLMMFEPNVTAVSARTKRREDGSISIRVVLDVKE